MTPAARPRKFSTIPTLPGSKDGAPSKSMSNPSIGNYAYILRYKLAVAYARRAGDPLRLAHRVRHLGDAYYYAGRFALAEPCYVEALAIYRRDAHTRPLDLANAIRSFAVLKDELGVAEEAQRLWQEAHDLYVGVNVPAGVAESAARLALLARRRGDLQRSRECLSEASAAADASDDPETLQYICKVRAQLAK
jgi:tetratricopeptide (TPR) repeat protein